MISMTRQQQGDFNRCCDFLARMIEKYGDSIELGTAQKVALIYEWTNASGDRQDYQRGGHIGTIFAQLSYPAFGSTACGYACFASWSRRIFSV